MFNVGEIPGPPKAGEFKKENVKHGRILPACSLSGKRSEEKPV